MKPRIGSLRQCVRTGSGAHPALYQMGNPEVKRPGSEANHSPPSTAEVKTVWCHISTPPVCLHDVVLN